MKRYEKEGKNEKGKLRKMREREKEREDGYEFSEHFLCSQNSGKSKERGRVSRAMG